MNKTNEFEQHYQSWKTSGISKAGYCKQENLVYSWFIYHCKRIDDKHQGFSQVKIKPKSNSSNSTGIEYHFSDGRYFVFPVNCSAVLIRQLIG